MELPYTVNEPLTAGGWGKLKKYRQSIYLKKPYYTLLTRLFAKKTKQEDVGKYIHSTKEVKITKMLKRMSNLRNFNRSTFYCSWILDISCLEFSKS